MSGRIIIHSKGNTHQEMRLRNKHWFFLGAGLALWTTWQASTAVGIFLGAVVPIQLGSGFYTGLTFIALVVPGLKDRPSLAAALSAGITAILAYNLPFKLGLVIAAVVGSWPVYGPSPDNESLADNDPGRRNHLCDPPVFHPPVWKNGNP